MALRVAQLTARVGLDDSDLRSGITSAQNAMGGLGRSFQDIGRQAVATAAGFIIRDIVIGSIRQASQALTDLRREMIGINREWEVFGTRYYVQLGRSHELAEQRLREIEEFARATPFELAGIIEADQQLQIFGLHSRDAARRFGMSGREIRTVAGDMAAGTRASFEEIAMWLGRFATGDTGQAIRRFQELGVVTRDELRSMGVEFDKAGALVSPVEEAFAALLRIGQQKFGGLMEVQAGTLQGIESNVADFMTTQKRLWGEPLFDAYKDGLGDLLNFLNTRGAVEMLDAGRQLWANMIGGLRESFTGMATEVGFWISEAFLWGENIAVSLAQGIGSPAGVAQIGWSIGTLGREIQKWLEPGSPPAVAPELTNWGASAAEAWLEGWADAVPAAAPYLKDLMRSLEPYLRQIEGGQEWNVEGFRAAFGARAGLYEGYVRAFEQMHLATQETADAREDLAEIEKTGSEEEIAAARRRLGLAETNEGRARQALQAEQRRISQRVASETELTRAVREQTAAITQQARVTADADAARAAAAERQLQQARLQLELTEAETPARQLEIWRRELAATQQDTVEWYQIRTTMVRLEQQMRREQETSSRSAGVALADEMAARTRAQEQEKLALAQQAEGLERVRELQGDVNYQAEQAARAGQTYDPDPAAPGLDAWWAVGKAIAGRLWDGFEVWARARWDAWAAGVAEWASSPETIAGFLQAGQTLGATLGSAIAGGLEGMGHLQRERERVSQYWAEQGEEELARAGGVFATVEEMVGGAIAEPTLGEAMAELAGTLVGAFFDAFSEEFHERGGFWGLLERARRDEESMARLKEDVYEKPFLYTDATKRVIGYEDEPLTWGKAAERATQDLLGAGDWLIGTLQRAFGMADPKEVPEAAEFGRRMSGEIMLPIETEFPLDLQSGLDASFAGLGTAAAGTAGSRLGAALLEALMRSLRLEGAGREGGAQEQPDISFFQRGTSYAPGGLAVVGEAGPELISLPRGSRVYTAEETREAVGGAQTMHHWHPGAIQITVHGGDPEKVRGGVLSALRAAGVTA